MAFLPAKVARNREPAGVLRVQVRVRTLSFQPHDRQGRQNVVLHLLIALAGSVRLVEQGEQAVAWRSVTTGDADGVVLEIDAPDEAVLRFDTPVVQHEVSLGEIAKEPVVVAAGGIDIQVIFEREPVGVGREVEFTFSEDALAPGCHPYWVRVVQTDGAKAWASPIYVTMQ